MPGYERTYKDTVINFAFLSAFPLPLGVYSDIQFRNLAYKGRRTRGVDDSGHCPSV